MSKFFDNLETRSDDERAGDLSKLIPLQIENSKENSEAFGEILRTVDPKEINSVEDLTKLPTADHVEPLTAETDGYLGMLDALAIGKGCVLLGAGRRTLEDVIDPAVGVVVRKKLGNPVTTGDTICLLYTSPSPRDS